MMRCSVEENRCLSLCRCLEAFWSEYRLWQKKREKPKTLNGRLPLEDSSVFDDSVLVLIVMTWSIIWDLLRFFRFFQKSLQKYFRGARIVNCFFRSGPDRQFFCFRGARIANFYFRGARIANFFALFVSRVSKILVFRFVSFVSFVSFRLFRIESLDFFCVNFLYIARTLVDWVI